MDRISALRNLEDALGDFEDGELSLPDLEREVRGIVRTYATDFADGKRAYRATGDPAAEGIVVLAESPAAAHDRIAQRVADGVRFEVEPTSR